MSVGTDLYPHMPILRSKRLPFGRRIRALADSSDIWASGGGAKFPKMCDSLPWTPTNHRAKFDAASFILGGKIRNRTNKQNKNSSGDEIANVNFLTTISHTRRPTSKFRKRDKPTSFNKLDDR